ncbi:MAG: UbiH/UbiF/VisC/COQ6 family ubiquinone biosynthesis hydroxylase [Octadecabacter sp.]|nr:UbiH/UbiF/VisC/COQ6 family ubiquinone biosynthesis hydroxylase [Octadecabacter sp.]
MDNPASGLILRIMNTDTDIAIVGGGLNGPTLAIALEQRGLNVTVIDALPAPKRGMRDFDGRSYALAHASMRLLRGIDLWDAIKDHTQPMLEIKVTDGRAGTGPSPWMMHFDHTEIEEGPMGYMCQDRHLRQALLAKMDGAARITQMSGETVVAQSSGQLILASGKTVTAKLIVGADGRASGTAERAGIKRTGWGYGQTAIVCAVEHELPHGGIAHQFFMPTGPLAILPLPDNCCSIVWSETETRATKIMAMDDTDFLDALRPAFGSFLGELILVGKRFSYPLGLTIANRFSADRVVLIGDAAHGVHPIAGQGLNAGLRDVAALVDVLSDAKARGEDIASAAVLARYEQWRRFDTATLAAATDTFNKLFSNDNPLLRAVRDMGMGVINATPRLRRTFIREAAGLTGDLPSLMRS